MSAGSRIADTHTPSSEFGDLYDRHINRLPRASRPSAAYVDVIRSRQLFKVIVQQNRALFENARVLELPSGDGRWGLAALDAGAAHVTCVEPLPRVADRAARTFAEAAPGSYEIVNADIFSALAHFEPNSFDLIMCVRFFERHRSAANVPRMAASSAAIRHSGHQRCARPRASAAFHAADAGNRGRQRGSAERRQR